MNNLLKPGNIPLDSLSNIELYYSEPENFQGGFAKITGEDSHHITNVMRHKPGDEIYLTNGVGKIYRGNISSVQKNDLNIELVEELNFNNKFKNITFCIPKLKNPDRFEFALEKSIELGITNFIIYSTKRSVTKGAKLERWNKIALAAMKQSLRSYLPNLFEEKDLKNIFNNDGEVFLFEQNSQRSVSDLKIEPDKNYYFLFGPEGGLDADELALTDEKHILNLAENRLRTETAIVKFAVALPTLFNM